MSAALGARSLSPWDTREVPDPAAFSNAQDGLLSMECYSPDPVGENPGVQRGGVTGPE